MTLVFSNLTRFSQQKVTIGIDGSISGLEYKPGKGADLKGLGDADVKRATDIVWDATAKAWKVQWLDFDKTGFMTYNEYVDALMSMVDQCMKTGNEKKARAIADRVEPWCYYGINHNVPENDPALFATYDDAVIAEIDTIEGLGLKPVRAS